MKNDDIERIKSETQEALIELESCIELLSAYVYTYADSTPFGHATILVKKMRELMDIVVENQDIIFE